MVDKLRTVVAMEPQYPKRKLMQHRFQHRYQMHLADGFRATHHLPLRYRVYRIEVKNARLAVVLPLMHDVHTQVPGLAFRIGLAAFSDRHMPRLWLP